MADDGTEQAESWLAGSPSASPPRPPAAAAAAAAAAACCDRVLSLSHLHRPPPRARARPAPRLHCTTTSCASCPPAPAHEHTHTHTHTHTQHTLAFTRSASRTECGGLLGLITDNCLFWANVGRKIPGIGRGRVLLWGRGNKVGRLGDPDLSSSEPLRPTSTLHYPSQQQAVPFRRSGPRLGMSAGAKVSPPSPDWAARAAVSRRRGGNSRQGDPNGVGARVFGANPAIASGGAIHYLRRRPVWLRLFFFFSFVFSFLFPEVYII